MYVQFILIEFVTIMKVITSYWCLHPQ